MKITSTVYNLIARSRYFAFPRAFYPQQLNASQAQVLFGVERPNSAG